MIYIITALKSEAQAFVDKYKLGKTKSNENLSIIVSGIGAKSMFEATKKVVEIMNESDIILNVGICGASEKFKIGDLLPHDTLLTCVDKPISNPNIYDAVDMESAGFIDATKEIKNKYIFKVVSDNFEPSIVTKETTKKLISQKIDEIMENINA